MICVKKLWSLCHVIYNKCNFQQIKFSISMTSLCTCSTCLVMLCSLVYFLDHLWMTSILFDANIYCRFFSISKLVNWVINGALVHKGLKNRKFSHIIHMLVGFIMCLVLLRNRTDGFPMFTNPCILHDICICINAECEFLHSHKHFVILIHQTC